MTKVSGSAAISAVVWKKYQNNLFRYLMVIGRFSETRLMNALQKKGYSNLSTSFANQMVLIARDNKGIRITDLAALQGISKQLCHQALRPIEQAGYIYRDVDPSDGRAKLVKLTPIAKQMIHDAFAELKNINIMFSNLIGSNNYKRLSEHIADITPSIFFEEKNVPDTFSASNLAFAVFAGQASRFFETKLINLNIAKGHHNLKPSFTQVLAYIDLKGSKINTIAEINSLSNQAIARISNELEAQGYIKRSTVTPTSNRKQLIFTRHGLQLISDSVDTINVLETQIKNQLGTKNYRDFDLTLNNLYTKIRTDDQSLDDFDPKSILIAESVIGKEPSKGRLTVQELLLFIASLCEKETTAPHTGNKLSRILENQHDSPITFSKAAARIVSNTAIQPDNIVIELEKRLGRKKTNTLLTLIDQLTAELDN